LVTDNAAVTAWYDSDCPLCVREIALMRRLDKRGAVRFVNIQSGEGCPVAPEALLERFHARELDGPLLSGAAAFAAIWRQIPMLRPLGELARRPRVLALLERLYVLFLRLRPLLQRTVGRLLGDPAG
jgi:predicted DCC family thiol-disulfide oxidoreductase YuxK